MNPYSVTYASSAFVSPLSLAAAKLHLRVTSTDEDPLITSLVAGVARSYETFTNRALVQRSFTWTLDEFPAEDDTLTVPVAPLVSVASIVYLDDAGTSTTFGSSNYVVDTNSQPGRIALAENQFWPTIDNRIQPITITFTAGESSVSSAGLNDADLAAIKLWVGHLYQHRESVVTGTIAQVVPQAFETLVWSRKVVLQ